MGYCMEHSGVGALLGWGSRSDAGHRVLGGAMAVVFEQFETEFAAVAAKDSAPLLPGCELLSVPLQSFGNLCNLLEAGSNR